LKSVPAFAKNFAYGHFMGDKMKCDNFSEKDLKKIAEDLNYDYEIVFTDRDTGKQL
jgi:hypothetical protein